MIAFAAAMGYLEAVCVLYLQRAISLDPRALFPVRDASTLDELATAEVAREFATLVMLWAVGWFNGRTVIARLAWTSVAFGIWDVVYYIGLNALIGWPDSLGTWDLLFMIPTPWAGPIWAPIAVSAFLITFGLLYARAAHRGDGLHLARNEWITLITGGVIVIIAFCWNAVTVLEYGVPTDFPVPVFAVGMLLGAMAALRPLRRVHTP